MASSEGVTPLPLERPYPPPSRPESIWPVQATVLAAIGLQLLLPERLTVGPTWLLPVLEGALLLAFAAATPRQLEHEHHLRREFALSLTAVVSAANATSLVLLCDELLGHGITNGRRLISAGALIWLTNVLIFSLWYWQIDRGGPGRRAAAHDGPPDFLFPQMNDDRIQPSGWRPAFIDYLYTSLTNAIAFSPTDTMPLTAIVKSLMGLQSIVSLITIGLVVARAVNILH
jgi:uncharacterized membrane protein